MPAISRGKCSYESVKNCAFMEVMGKKIFQARVLNTLQNRFLDFFIHSSRKENKEKHGVKI